MRARPLHVVQVSLDDSVFDTSSGSDALDRQCGYARLLCEMRPGSRLTLLVLTRRRDARRFAKEDVVFVPQRYSRWWDLPRVHRGLEALHRERAIDVVSPQNVQDEGWVALVFAKRHGIPCVGQIHFDYFSLMAREEMFGRGLRGAIRLGLTEWLLPRFDRLRVVGRRLRDEIVARGMHRDVSVIPVPVSVDLAASDPGVSPSESVLFVGRLVPAKNLGGWMAVASRVAAELPKARFTIAGGGSEEAFVRAEAERLGIASRVDLLGVVPHRDLAAVYRSASVFLLTSHYEGFGRVVAEAQAYGVPVVAPRINGVEDIVADGETGLLAAPGDIEGLAERVTRLLRDRDLASRLGAAGAVRTRNLFDPKTLARAWVELLVSPAARGATKVPREFTLDDKYVVVARLLRDASGSLLDLGARDRILARRLVPGTIDYRSADTGEGHDYRLDLEGPTGFADQEFDHVVALDVLEHVERIHDAFHELARIARRTLIIALPNIASLTKRWSFLRAGHLGTGKYDLLPDHQGDRHRWLTVYDEMNHFVEVNARKAGLELTSIVEELEKYRLVAPIALALAKSGLVRGGLFTDRCIYVMTRSASAR